MILYTHFGVFISYEKGNRPSLSIGNLPSTSIGNKYAVLTTTSPAPFGFINQPALNKTGHLFSSIRNESSRRAIVCSARVCSGYDQCRRWRSGFPHQQFIYLIAGHRHRFKYVCTTTNVSSNRISGN